jgi:hypothetical protein
MTRHGDPIEGGLYVIESESRFRVLKVLRVEDDVVHVRIYKNTYESVPGRVDPSTLALGTIHDEDGFGIGHQPTRLKTFLSWHPQFLQHSLVEDSELEGYNYWKEVGGGVWE